MIPLLVGFPAAIVSAALSYKSCNFHEPVINRVLSFVCSRTGCSYQSHGGGGGRDVNAVKPDSDQYAGPQFDPETPSNVTALEGKSAYLTCKVKNLDNKTVRVPVDVHRGGITGNGRARTRKKK